MAVTGCDPNVLIGARWRSEGAGAAGQPSVAGTEAGGHGGSAGAAPSQGGTSDVAEGGAPPDPGGAAGDGGSGGEPAVEEWCATAPWLNTPVVFANAAGNVIPAGSYVIRYVGGAQIHDGKLGFEVTGHYYGKNGILAGHHVFSGSSPETGATHLWLEDTGLVRGGSVDEVELANAGYRWLLEHAGGELSITLYDDVYEDNFGPGTRLCIARAP